MILLRVTAAACFLAGGLSLGAALESECAAIQCNLVVHSPAQCVHAHIEAPVDETTNLGCVKEPNSPCHGTEGSRCGDDLGWGRAVPGRCQTQTDITSTLYDCHENYGSTLLTLYKYTSWCSFQGAWNGTDLCLCIVMEDWEQPYTPYDTEVCDCIQQY